MRKSEEFACRQETPFNDARVVAFVSDDIFTFADEGADDTQVYLKTSAVKQDCFLVHQASQGGFKFQVNVQSAIKEAGTGTAGAIFLDCGTGRLFDSGMVGKAEVAVGPQHQHLFALDDDLCVLGGRNRAKIRVQPSR